MNRALKILIPVFACLFILGPFIPRKGDLGYIKAFSKLPVQVDGRIKPLDTVARTSLTFFSGKQSVKTESETLHAAPWLMDVLMEPSKADHYPVFKIENDQVLGLLGYQKGKKQYFSYNELEPHFASIFEQQKGVNDTPELRTPYEKHIVKLADSLTIYYKLTQSLQPPANQNLLAEYTSWTLLIPESLARLASKEPGDSESLNTFTQLANRYIDLSQNAYLGIAPETHADDWDNIGHLLLSSIQTGTLSPAAESYAQVITAYRSGDTKAIKTHIDTLSSYFEGTVNLFKIRYEVFLNTVQPFYKASVLYVFACIIILFSWLFKKETSLAWSLIIIACILHTWGLASRIYIQGRPPVTNLYSSAVFIGWAAVLSGILFERIYKNGLGLFVSSLVGFSTLVIAHNLALSGDTLEMMRAVLDSNFWLSTHVVIVTLGYAAMFLAGTFGIIYVIKRSFSKSLDDDLQKSLKQMTYATICFATLFSFVGTMLGGIWADQSWGRFWGWDPKENGALLIVLWCAITLHAKWGRLVEVRGFMMMAIFGNIITAWSWFGTNMLGVGLHSYGFTDRAFFALAAFICSQLAIMLLALVPTKR